MDFVNLKDCNTGVFTKERLGNKGYHLMELSQMGIQIPQGIIFFTDLCREYYRSGKRLHNDLREKILAGIHALEISTGKYLGNIHAPLIISVRSGAPVSMPGMLDTILNVGINEQILCNCNQLYLFQSYLHFIKSYAKSVKNITFQDFDDMETTDREVLFYMIRHCKHQYQQKTGERFPEDTVECVINCVIAVMDSWNHTNAVVYRKKKGISDELYTAVILQEMVFGNYNPNSGAGVVFSQNPITGEKELYGEYLPCTQGEDIVSGISDPVSMEQMKQTEPEIYHSLYRGVKSIDEHFGCPQDIEFTYENGILYILQTREIRQRHHHQ